MTFYNGTSRHIFKSREKEISIEGEGGGESVKFSSNTFNQDRVTGRLVSTSDVPNTRIRQSRFPVNSGPLHRSVGTTIRCLTLSLTEPGTVNVVQQLLNRNWPPFRTKPTPSPISCSPLFFSSVSILYPFIFTSPLPYSCLSSTN